MGQNITFSVFITTPCLYKICYHGNCVFHTLQLCIILYAICLIDQFAVDRCKFSLCTVLTRDKQHASSVNINIMFISTVHRRITYSYIILPLVIARWSMCMDLCVWGGRGIIIICYYFLFVFLNIPRSMFSPDIKTLIGVANHETEGGKMSLSYFGLHLQDRLCCQYGPI